MGVYAMQWAFQAPIHISGAKFILVALAEHARDNDSGNWTCFPSVKRLSRWTAQGERTIERHLSWLVAEGWISREIRRHKRRGESLYFYELLRAKAPSDWDVGAQRVHEEARTAANLAAKHTPLSRQTGTKHPPVSTRSPANLAPAYMEEPEVEPVSEPSARGALDVEGCFADFWAVYPNKVEERGARAVVRRLLVCGEVTPEELVGGARGYAALVRGREPRFIKGPLSWLSGGCWADCATPPKSADSGGSPLAAFNGPAHIWASVSDAKGPAWAMSYLAPCAWAASSRTLQTRTAFAARKLRDELGGLLRELSVSVIEPAASHGAAHVH